MEMHVCLWWIAKPFMLSYVGSPLLHQDLGSLADGGRFQWNCAKIMFTEIMLRYVCWNENFHVSYLRVSDNYQWSIFKVIKDYNTCVQVVYDYMRSESTYSHVHSTTYICLFRSALTARVMTKTYSYVSYTTIMVWTRISLPRTRISSAGLYLIPPISVGISLSAVNVEAVTLF